tara:strand:+ start:1963 stop:2160 length:198 start_codon:yes stop_codon:yes gene_type:complete
MNILGGKSNSLNKNDIDDIDTLADERRKNMQRNKKLGGSGGNMLAGNDLNSNPLLAKKITSLGGY